MARRTLECRWGASIHTGGAHSILLGSLNAAERGRKNDTYDGWSRTHMVASDDIKTSPLDALSVTLPRPLAAIAAD